MAPGKSRKEPAGPIWVRINEEGVRVLSLAIPLGDELQDDDMASPLTKVLSPLCVNCKFGVQVFTNGIMSVCVPVTVT